LLQTPTSKIIITLDSDHSFNLKSSQLSWDPLITNLRSSSPEKAHLVITLTFSFHFFSCLLVKCKKWQVRKKNSGNGNMGFSCFFFGREKWVIGSVLGSYSKLKKN
jgi:hypothetical protein